MEFPTGNDPNVAVPIEDVFSKEALTQRAEPVPEAESKADFGMAPPQSEAPDEDEGMVDLTAVLGQGQRTSRDVLNKIKRVGSEQVEGGAQAKGGNKLNDEEETIDLSVLLGRGKQTTKDVLAKIKRVGSEQTLDLHPSDGAKTGKKGSGKKGKRRPSADGRAGKRNRRKSASGEGAGEGETMIDLTALLGRGKRTTKGMLEKI